MSRIVAIGSGKGGVGKTWLAIGLAQALARLGRRVLLFDGDLGLANVDIQLGLGSGPDLGNVLAGQSALTDVVRPLPEVGFDLIPGRSGCGRLALLAPARLDHLLVDLWALARAYDELVIDLAAGLDMAVRRVLARADLPLVVTTDEPTAITDAYALIKVHQRGQGVGQPQFVVNLAASHHAGRQTYEGLRRVCAQFLRFEPGLAGVLRHDPRVPDAIRAQTPFLVRHPLAPAARDLESLALHLVRDRSDRSTPPPPVGRP